MWTCDRCFSLLSLIKKSSDADLHQLYFTISKFLYLKYHWQQVVLFLLVCLTCQCCGEFQCYLPPLHGQSVVVWSEFMWAWWVNIESVLLENCVAIRLFLRQLAPGIVFRWIDGWMDVWTDGCSHSSMKIIKQKAINNIKTTQNWNHENL